MDLRFRLWLVVLFLVPMSILVLYSLWRINSHLQIVPDWNLDNYSVYVNEPTYLRTFGKTISEFQAIQWKLADNVTRIEAARLLTYRAAYLKDQGMRTTRESAMAKLYASEIAVKAADDCVQVHGGYGFVKDYPAEKYFRDVKLTTIGEGTSEIQRLVIARQLLA